MKTWWEKHESFCRYKASADKMCYYFLTEIDDNLPPRLCDQLTCPIEHGDANFRKLRSAKLQQLIAPCSEGADAPHGENASSA